MGYRNRRIIEDKTGEIYNQGLNTLTNMFVKTIVTRGEQQRLNNEKIKKERLDAQRGMLALEDEQDKLTQPNEDAIYGIDGNLGNSFKDNLKTLSGPALQHGGARLVDLNMSDEDRDSGKASVEKFEMYNKSMGELGGLFKSEITERYGNSEGGIQTGGFNIQSYGVEWDYVGDNAGDKLTSQFSLSALDNTPANIYGATMTKKGGYNEKGVADTTISTVIPTNNKDFLRDNPLFDKAKFIKENFNDKDLGELDEDVKESMWNDHKKENGIIEKDGKFVFEKTYNKKNFGEGFTTRTMEGPDSKAIFQDTDTTTDTNGGLPDSAYLTDEFNSFRRKGEVQGVKQESRQRYVNPNHFIGEESPSWGTAQFAAEGALTASNSDIKRYLNGRLDVADSESMKTEGVWDVNKVAKAIQTKLTEKTLSKMTPVSHMINGEKVMGANKDDVAYYKKQGIDIELGQTIYYEGSRPTDVKSGTETISDDLLLAENLQLEINNLPVGKDRGTNIDNDKKWLEGKGLKILKKDDAIKDIRLQVEANSKIKDPRKRQMDSDGRVYDAEYLSDIENSTDDIFLTSNGKTTFLPGYDPFDKSSMMTILNKYGGLSQKTRTRSKLNISQANNKKTAHLAYQAAGGTLGPSAWEKAGKPKK